MRDRVVTQTPVAPGAALLDSQPALAPKADRADTGLFHLSDPPGGADRGRAAVFDLDRTLIRVPAVIAAVPTLRRAGMLQTAGLWRAMRAQPAYLRRTLSYADVARLGAVVLSVTEGWDADEVRRAVAAAAPRLVSRIQYRHARSLVEAHRAAGDVLVVASSAPSDLVVPIAREFGADIALATTAHLDADGRYTGRLAFLCNGPAKAAAVGALAARLGIDLRSSSAYSDSVTDLPLLAAVGVPVATNPDRSLAAVARQRGWPIVHLGERTISLGSPKSVTFMGGARHTRDGEGARSR